MARQTESQALQQLREHYHALPDGQLLNLAAKPDDLTDMAQEVLHSEMANRRLKLDCEVPPANCFEAAKRDPESGNGSDIAGRTVLLMTFIDAIKARQACDLLDGNGIAIEVRDRSVRYPKIKARFDSPAVLLDICILPADWARAAKILREEMGLFPLQEGEAEDETAEDERVLPAGYFGMRENAEEVARVLDDARILHRIVPNQDGSLENEDAYKLEVKEVDLERVGEVIEKAMGSL